MLRGFRDFIMRGNVVDLAVAVVIGAAFGAVVAAFADDFVGGILGAIGGTTDIGDAGFTVTHGKIAEIDLLADPARLRQLNLTVLDG